MFNIKKQLSGLYLSSIFSSLSLTGAWVAILAARGYSLVEIGIVETAFHITSLIFEIPSGVLADVFGRKRMLVVSVILRMIGNVVMILSCDLFTVCLSISFHALSYNFDSGSGTALAYDSLRSVQQENRFERFESNLLMIYRLFGGISTLCAGFALYLGHQIAYGTDLLSGAVQLLVLTRVQEFMAQDTGSEPLIRRLTGCFRNSFRFLSQHRRVMGLMFCNSLVGAVDTLLLFFLQAKLPERGLSGQLLGVVLLIMAMGGVVGSKLILKAPRLSYRTVLALAAALVCAGFLAEHSPLWIVMALGGFLSALGDDALQVRTNARIQDMIPSQQRATLTSVDSFLFSVVMIVLSPLAGYIFTIW